jgi:hypothetical protein
LFLRDRKNTLIFIDKKSGKKGNLIIKIRKWIKLNVRHEYIYLRSKKWRIKKKNIKVIRNNKIFFKFN